MQPEPTEPKLPEGLQAALWILAFILAAMVIIEIGVSI